MDIWHSASGSHEYIDTGWIGRFLDNECKSASEAFELNHELSLALKGKELSGIAAYNLKALHNKLRSPFYDQLVSAVQNNLPTDGSEDFWTTNAKAQARLLS